MPCLYLIRHLPPILPTQQSYCYGQTNLESSTISQEKSDQINACLPVSGCLFSSPLSRCHLLAESLRAKRNTQLCLDPRLKEINFGAWEMKTWDDIGAQPIKTWSKNIMDYKDHGGESVRQLQKRVASFLNSIKAFDRSIIVTHAGVIRVAIALMTGQPIAKCLNLPIDFGGVSLIQNKQLISTNLTTHHAI